MPNTTPAIDEPGVVARVRSAAEARGSPVRVLVARGGDAGRAGRDARRRSASSPTPGSSGFSDDGAPVRSASLLANALAYAGPLGLPDRRPSRGPVAHRGRRGGRGVRRDRARAAWLARSRQSRHPSPAIAILADVVRDVPGARLHLTHVSTAASLAQVRRAKAAGLPVTCDVTPHHLGLTDEWIAGVPPLGVGRRRRRRPRPRPVGRRRDHRRRRSTRRCASTRRCGRPRTRSRASRRSRRHRGRHRHRPRARTPRSTSTSSSAGRRTGSAASRRRSASCWPRSTRAVLPLARAIEALTTGPAAVLGRQAAGAPTAVRDGEPADLVVIDRGATWRVEPGSLRSKGKNSPLLGRELAGRGAADARGRPGRLREVIAGRGRCGRPSGRRATSDRPPPPRRPSPTSAGSCRPRRPRRARVRRRPGRRA